MIVYSKKIIQFVSEIKSAAKNILSKEVGVKVWGDRFYDRREKTSYPLQIVVYNNKSMLGYFDPNFYELGFHECLMHSSKQQLHNVIRHELAHYITFINYGEGISAHGTEFRAFCQLMEWGEDVYRATLCLEGEQTISDIEESSVLRKVQKLMSLATSSNKNEAEQAMIKSQQLLLKHNLESKYIGEEDDEKLFLKRILKQKKETAKMRCIGTILKTFFVNIVYNRGGGFTCLEVLGTAVNIEIAEYVATVLDSELENLWNQARRQANLKGMVAKNSFFTGIAKGYCNKVDALKREYNTDVTRALMVIEKQLVDARDMVYPRLSSSRSSGSHCQASSTLGEKMGRQLNINTAINRSSANTQTYIAYSS